VSKDLDLFISYSIADLEKVRSVAAYLQEHGVRTFNNKIWPASDDMRPGRTFTNDMLRGIKDATCFAFAISPDFLRSNDTSREVARAFELHKPFFPLYLRTVTTDGAEILPHVYRSFDYADCRDPKRMAIARQRLLLWVRQHVSVPISTPPPPIEGAFETVRDQVALLFQDSNDARPIGCVFAEHHELCCAELVGRAAEELLRSGRLVEIRQVGRGRDRGGRANIDAVEPGSRPGFATLRSLPHGYFPTEASFRVLEAPTGPPANGLGTILLSNQNDGFEFQIDYPQIDGWGKPARLPGVDQSRLFVQGAPLFDRRATILGFLVEDRGSGELRAFSMQPRSNPDV